MENPYLSEAMSNAGAGLQMAQALRSAAAQQQKLDQQEREKQASTALEIYGKGGVPWEPYHDLNTQPSGPGAPKTLQRRDPNPVPPGHQIYTDAWGRQWALPDPKAAQGQTELQSALEKGGQPLTPRGQLMDPSLANVPRMQTDANGTLTPTGKSGTTMPVPDEGRVVHPGGGQQGLYMPTPDESLASKLKTEAANKPPKEPRTRVDTESFSQPVLIDEESGDVKPLKIPEGITHTGKPSAGHGYQFSYHTDDEGNVHVLRGDPDSGEVTEVKTVKGAGGKKKDPDAPAKPSAAQLRLITEKKATGLKQAEQSYGKLMTDMGGAMSPEDKQAAVASLTKAKQAAQDEYEQSLSALGLPVQHFDFGSQAEPQATDAGGGNRVGRGGLITSAPAKKASAKGKLTDTNVAQQYLQKAGGDKAKARQLAKADGWEF